MAAVLGLVVAACLWWAYFDVVSIVAERVLRRLDGEERTRLARDAYSYLHLPMVAGIVLVARGIEEVMHNVGHATDGDLSRSLSIVPLMSLFGGVALFLFGHIAFKYRTWGTVTVRRLVVALLLCAVIPLAAELPSFGRARAARGRPRDDDRVGGDPVRRGAGAGSATRMSVPRCIPGIAKPIRGRRSGEPDAQSSARRSSAVALIRAASAG